MEAVVGKREDNEIYINYYVLLAILINDKTHRVRLGIFFHRPSKKDRSEIELCLRELFLRFENCSDLNQIFYCLHSHSKLHPYQQKHIVLGMFQIDLQFILNAKTRITCNYYRCLCVFEHVFAIVLPNKATNTRRKNPFQYAREPPRDIQSHASSAVQ